MVITLSTGRTMEANRGMLGINALLEVGEGYDGDLRPPAVRESWMEDDEPTLSPAEQIELAGIVISWWQKFADRARSNLQST